MKAFVLAGSLASALLLGGCNSEPTVESGTVAAPSKPNLAEASKPIDHMPAGAKAAMEAGGGRAAPTTGR